MEDLPSGVMPAAAAETLPVEILDANVTGLPVKSEILDGGEVHAESMGTRVRKSSSTTVASNKMGPGIGKSFSSSSPSVSTTAPNAVAPVDTSYNSSSSATALEIAFEFWSGLDLSGACRAELERQGRELKEAKESTIRNRKRLTEATREWKKKGENNKSEFEVLLKAYQEEIDRLTRRAKGAEAAFANAYQVLHQAPDPTPLLDKARSDNRTGATLKAELGRLQQEVDEYEVEFRKLKNQDVTIRRLQESLTAYEQGAAGDMAASIESARVEIEALANARVCEAKERERRMEGRLRVAEAAEAAAEGMRARAQSELLELARLAEEKVAAMTAEGDLLVQERERFEAEAVALRRELETVKMAASEAGRDGADGQPVSLRSSSASSDTGKSCVEALEKELEEMGASLAAVRQRLLVKEEEWASSQRRAREAAAALEKELEEERKARSKAEEEAQERPSREEVGKLRARVRLLQQLGFNGAEEEEGEGGEGMTLGGPSGTAGRPEEAVDRVPSAAEEGEVKEESIVEDQSQEGAGGTGVGRLLMARLRRMETEVMSGRRRIAELEGERARLENEKGSAEARVVELSALISRLEDDLARVASKGVGDVMAEGTVGSQSRTPSVPPGRGPSWKVASSRDEEDLDVDMHELLASTTQPAPALGASPSASLDLVRILQAQRDRYKARTRELEGRLAAVEQESGRHKAQAESMLRDNLKLYEKVRFLQSYKKGRVGPDALDSTQDKRMSGLEHSTLHQRNVVNDEGKGAQEYALEAGRVPTGAGAAATEARYRAMYEEQMNPFTAFSVAERVRKYQDLSVIDKITLQTTRAFLAHKKARMAVFFYAVSLHLLVFLTLYMWGHHHCTDLHYQADVLMGHPPEPLGMQSLSMGNHAVGGGANHLEG